MPNLLPIATISNDATTLVKLDKLSKILQNNNKAIARPSWCYMPTRVKSLRWLDQQRVIWQPISNAVEKMQQTAPFPSTFTAPVLMIVYSLSFQQ
jgi:hypothetical protein